MEEEASRVGSLQSKCAKILCKKSFIQSPNYYSKIPKTISNFLFSYYTSNNLISSLTLPYFYDIHFDNEYKGEEENYANKREKLSLNLQQRVDNSTLKNISFHFPYLKSFSLSNSSQISEFQFSDVFYGFFRFHLFYYILFFIKMN